MMINVEYRPALPGGSAVSIRTHPGRPCGCLEAYAVIDRVLRGKCSRASFKRARSLGRKREQTLAAGRATGHLSAVSGWGPYGTMASQLSASGPFCSPLHVSEAD